MDFVKDTFAKYGLNMNLYNPNLLGAPGSELNQIPGFDKPKEDPANEKLQKLLDIIPDYGFLLESKLCLP